MSKISSAQVLQAANRFLKRAQMSVTYDPDKMKAELDRTIGKGVQAKVTEFLSTKPISTAQINIEYTPGPKPVAAFKAYTNNDSVGQELSSALNQMFAAKATPIVSKYQKDKPLDYKYLEMEA